MRPLMAFLLSLFISQAVLAGETISSMPDIPLAPGLKEVKENGSVMEGPLGPIIVAYAKSDGPADKVRSFYDEELPKLGWEKDGNKWHRPGQILAVDFVGTGRDPVVVTFSLHGGGSK
jgi:hypothetical protein